ncbi:MAG: T9SS type A sorting domain-containing protein [Parafilimonas sp.]|nr:T9SS type A sorting domain-containing protein [Parafilimonas sp.]
MKIKYLRSRYTALLFLILCISKIEAQVNASDSLALVDLYNNTNGTGWKNSTNWLTAKPVSKWYGVTVTGNRVTSVSLTFNKLSGQLPASVGNLSELTDLELYNNNLQGSLNTVIKLTKLLTLDLSSNAFTGNIPGQLSQLSQLKTLSLSNNKLTGSIPASICTIKPLQKLYLGNNQLSGSIPKNIDSLVFLGFLNLSYNHLSGDLPPGFYQLYGLVTAQLQNNQFSGKLLNRFGNFPKMITLMLNDNQFSGSIPGTFGQLGNLANLYLQNNHLSGAIPSLLGYCAGLIELNISNNQLKGTLPLSLINLTRLSAFDVSGNRLSGELPTQIITMPSLLSLKASDNHLTFTKNINNTDSTNLNSTDLSNNDFNFNGLEYIASNVPKPIYAPQAQITIHQHGAVLSVYVGGRLSNNTYTWHLINGNTTVLSADSIFTPSQPGSYYVTVTNKVAAKLTLISDTVTVASANTVDVAPLSIAPNPVLNILNIHGLNATVNSNITISDLKGDIVLNASSYKHSTFKLDVSKLQPGSYIININDGAALKTIHFIKE